MFCSLFSFPLCLGLSWSNPLRRNGFTSSAWIAWQRRCFVRKLERIVHISQRSVSKRLGKLYFDHGTSCFVLCSTGMLLTMMKSFLVSYFLLSQLHLHSFLFCSVIPSIDFTRSIAKIYRDRSGYVKLSSIHIYFCKNAKNVLVTSCHWLLISWNRYNA